MTELEMKFDKFCTKHETCNGCKYYKPSKDENCNMQYAYDLGYRQGVKDGKEKIKKKTIDEILKWIKSQTETIGRIEYSASSKMIVEHLQEMRKEIMK